MNQLKVGASVRGAVVVVLCIVAQLALTDIYHGETDVSLEWRAVQAAFGVIIAFHLTALVALIRLRTPDPALESAASNA